MPLVMPLPVNRLIRTVPEASEKAWISLPSAVIALEGTTALSGVVNQRRTSWLGVKPVPVKVKLAPPEAHLGTTEPFTSAGTLLQTSLGTGVGSLPPFFDTSLNQAMA